MSLIIPALHDAAGTETALLSVPPSADLEIIVVNGGPADERLQMLRERFKDAQWLSSPAGRARQMNHGARHAQGRWLLFLHADTRLSPGWMDEVRRADRDPGTAGGSFRLVLNSPATPARLIEWGVRQRVRWLDLPYGDQALFVRRSIFEALHGYRDIPLMEDVDFARRLRRAGALLRSDLPALTSARRWERDGWVRRSAENLLLVALYFAGVPPARLATRYYRRDRGE